MIFERRGERPMDVFHTKGAALLIQAILALETEEECRAFLEDLMTGREIQDCSQRILVASLLREAGLQPHRPGHRRQQRHHQPGQPLLHLRLRWIQGCAGPDRGKRHGG